MPSSSWCSPRAAKRPPVLRRTAVPVVTDLGEAARRPELGMHVETEQGATIAAAMLPAIQGLDDDQGRLYYDLVYNSLNEAARAALASC